MTQVGGNSGILFPNWGAMQENIGTGMNSNATLNAATDKIAWIGYARNAGRATKTIDTSGSSAISFRLSALTFANGSTTIDVGIQDVGTSGPPGQPDGAFDVKRTITGGDGSITGAAWNNLSLATGTVTGSKSIAHGQLIAVVLDMTARGGADSVPVQDFNATTRGLPTSNVFDAGAWGSGTERIPNVVLTYSDGTLGCIDGGGVFTSSGVQGFADATSPDERGIIFQVPWTCKVDAIWFVGGVTDTNSDFTIALYSAPTTAASALETITVDAANFGITSGDGINVFPLSQEYTLTKNTDYAVAVKATGSSNVRFFNAVANDAAYLALTTNGSTISQATRDGGTGNFSSTAATIYFCGVRISSLDDGTGSGKYPMGGMTGGFLG